MSVSREVLISKNIQTDQDISSENILKIKREVISIEIKTKALNLLKYRDRSKKELEIHLFHKGYKKSDISYVLKRLEIKGLINDKKFAKQLALHLINVKMLGRIAVVNRFRKHAIDFDLLNQILDELYNKSKPNIIIKKLIEKKSKSDTSDIQKNKKLLNFLKNKGFSWTEISNALNDF